MIKQINFKRSFKENLKRLMKKHSVPRTKNGGIDLYQALRAFGYFPKSDVEAFFKGRKRLLYYSNKNEYVMEDISFENGKNST